MHTSYLPHPAAGIKRLRFTDWGLTNDNNVARWADRSTPANVSQVYVRERQAQISSVTCRSLTAAPHAFMPSGAAVGVEVTTAAPHGLATGTRVRITGADGFFDLGGGDSASHNTPEGRTSMVFALDDYTLLLEVPDVSGEPVGG